MAIQLFSNNAISALADPLLTAETSMSVTTGDGALFQAPTGGDFQVITLQDPANSSNYEIVYATARATDGFTVARAKEGTSATDWPIGTLVIGGITSGTVDYWPKYNTTQYAWSIYGTQKVIKATGVDAGYEELMYGSAEVVIMSEVINLKTTADNACNFTFGTGTTFYANECGVIITTANTVTVQPFISFGEFAATTSLLVSTQTTALTAAKHRQRFPTMVKDSGVTDISASVKTGATATSMQGRFYFKGLLVEDQ